MMKALYGNLWFPLCCMGCIYHTRQFWVVSDSSTAILEPWESGDLVVIHQGKGDVSQELTEVCILKAVKILCSYRKSQKCPIEDFNILISAHFESFEKIRHKQRLACSDWERVDICSKNGN